MPDETIDPNTAPETDQAPPVEDPYFVRKDGTKVTGATGQETPEEPDKPAEPTDEPKPEKQAAKGEDGKKKTFGEAWKEVRQQRKEAAAALARAEEAASAAQQERDALAAEREEMRKDFRGYLRKQGISLRELLEADLKEQDVDPHEKRARSLEEKLEDALKRLERFEQHEQRTAQQATAQKEIAGIEAQAKAMAEDFPLVAARAEKIAASMHSYWYQHLRETGEKLTLDQLFQAHEDYLRDLGVAAPNPPTTQQQSRKAAPPVRGKGAVKPANHVVGDADEDGDGAELDAAPAITNRTAAERASNGRPMTREERLARASARIAFRGSN